MSQATRGVVLAGGDSVRFGDRDKALAPVAGRPMISRVADAIQTATGRSPVVAVAETNRRDRYQRALEGAEFVLDAPEWQGPLAGLAAAVAHVEADRLFVCACDMPDLDPVAIEWLGHGRTGREAVVPVADGVRQPLHAWYRRDAIQAALTDDVDRLMGLLDRLDVDYLPVDDAPMAVPLAASLRNVNTQAELTSD